MLRDLFAEHQYFLESLVALLRPGEDTRIASIKIDLKGTFTFTRRQRFHKGMMVIFDFVMTLLRLSGRGMISSKSQSREPYLEDSAALFNRSLITSVVLGKKEIGGFSFWK
ncbi:hypothetical protein YC2023_054400 [Brassica napus]